MADGTLYRVALPYAVFGIILNAGTVVEAAPIGKWMVGKHFTFVQKWVKFKGGTVKRARGEAK